MHLDRVDFTRNVLVPFDNNWSSPFNWIGGHAPDLTQHARIGFGNAVAAALPANARSLDLSSNSNVSLQGILAIVTDANIRGASEMTIGQSSVTSVGNAMTLSDLGSRVTRQGGQLEVGADNQSGLNLPSYWSVTEKGRLNLNWVHHSTPSVQGSRLVNHGTISSHGSFLNRLDNQSEMIVGHDNDIGIIDLSGEFIQFETGSLMIQLGGLVLDSQHDQLRSQNDVHLDGLLQVSLFGDILPLAGDMFRLIDATNNGKVFGQ